MSRKTGFYIKLTNEDRVALSLMAAEEYRDEREQAAFLINRGVAGYLEAAQNLLLELENDLKIENK